MPGAVVASCALVSAVAFESGPLGFIPPLARYPLGLVALLACWRPRPRFLAALELCGGSAVLVTWALLRVIGLHPSRADDGIYFYLATRVADGAVPYRDFFFAHPPLHLLVPAIAFKLAGFSLVWAKLLPALIQSVAALLLFLAVRPTSRVLALLAVAIQLSSYQVLMGATDLTGANLVTALLMAALLATTRGRTLTAGFFSGLSLGAGLYAAAAVLALAVTRPRREWARGGLGLVSGVGVWLLPSALFGGRSFFDGVFRYHLAKGAPASSGRAPVFTGGPIDFGLALVGNLRESLTGSGLQTFYFHAAQLVAAAIALALLVRPGPWGAKERLVALGLLAAGLFTLQWAALPEVHDYYAVPQVAFLSLPAAWGLWRVFELLRERPALGGGLALLLFLTPVLAYGARGVLWPEERREAGAVVTYRWNDPWVPGPLAAMARTLFFTPERARDSLQPAWRHFVWNKSLTVSSAGELAAFVRANTLEDETIAGASTLAPLVALLAQRRLAGDQADTNTKRFRTGSLDERAFFERACADRLRYLVAAPASYFSPGLLERHPTVSRWFAKEREFVETELRVGREERYVLYRRLDGPACAYVDR